MSAAMPKEKTSAVSLSESNFTELKLKDLASSAATTAQDTTTSAATNRLQSTTHKRNTCDFGGATTTATADRNKYLANGNSSPLAAAAAASSHNHSCAAATLEPPQCNDSSFTADGTCCRLRMPLGNSGGQGHSNEASLEVNRATPVTPPKKSPKDFIFGKYIGEGSFSIVYLAVDVNTKREYAIKVCEKRHILREHKQEYIRREREVMNIMTNVPGFVNLSCTFQDVRSLYFVMTYAKNGDLLPYINKVGSFDVNCTRHYAAELVLACEEMHRRNVVHRDLKPENILLDEDMHTLIADFGSAKILTAEYRAAATSAQTATSSSGATNDRPSRTNMRRGVDNDDDENNDEDDTTNDTSSDEVDSASRQPARHNRKRKGSFVGTAQYVSPEVLQNGPITPAADLWALGCVIYQMIASLPPFRGSNDYVIFKEILACDLDFPEGFDKDAEDLVRQLLKVNPEERLGAQDEGGCYDSIRVHPFFKNVDFDTVRQQVPPPIYPYLPGDSKDGDYRSQSRIPDNLEPGLDDKQVTRLLGMELGTAERIDLMNDVDEIEQKTVTDHIFDLTDAAKQKRLEPCSSKSFQSFKALEFYNSYRSKLIWPAGIRLLSTGLEQQKSDKWHVFADNEIILKKGYINKRKGLFARKRMLLLTTGPRLIYIDPVHMIKKGEIPWSPELRVEPKNFKIFFVHTPNRTYYLEDPEGYSLEWVDAVEKMRLLTYRKNAEKQLLNADT